MNRKQSICIFLFILILLFTAACNDSNVSGNKDDEKGNEEIEKFFMAYLPLEGSEGVQQTNEDFENQLSEAIDLPVESYQATSYNSAIEAMKNGKADLIIMPPFAYVLGVERAGIEAIVGAKQTPGVQSSIIVAADSDIQTLEDLRGKTFGFVDPASSTGHLIPKTLLLEELGLTLDELENEFFSEIQFAGSHDSATIGAVNKQYDASAVATPIISTLIDNGLIEEGAYRVIAESVESPPTPMAIRSDLPEDLKNTVQDFLLNYDGGPEFLENLLGMRNAEFIKVDDSDYDYYRNMAELLEMSPEELIDS